MANKVWVTALTLSNELKTTPGALRVKLSRAGISPDKMGTDEKGHWAGVYGPKTVKKVRELYKPKGAGK